MNSMILEGNASQIFLQGHGLPSLLQKKSGLACVASRPCRLQKTAALYATQGTMLLDSVTGLMMRVSVLHTGLQWGKTMRMTI